MAEATHHDAQLVVQLAQLYTQSDAAKGGMLVWREDFPTDYDAYRERYPMGDEEARPITALFGFYETVGALWKHGVINEELLFDWISVRAVWQRLKPIAEGMREEAGEPRLWELFEQMAHAQTPAATPA
jgi:hypothetical protein